MLLPSVLLLATTVTAVNVTDVPNPRQSGGWVTDMAHVMDGATVLAMEQQLGALARDTTVEVAVVTVDNVPGTPKEFATELFNRWRIGKARADNGLLVLLVTGQRRLEMETGYGLEPILPDGWLGSMQNEAMVPHFKAGRYGAGLMEGVIRTAARVREHADEAREGTRKTVMDPNTKVAVWVGLGVLGIPLGILIFVVFMNRRQRRLERTCDTCKGDMELLPESKEDKYLDKAQQLEESLGSILYDVFFCRRCGTHRVVPRNKWFTRYSRCGRCNRKTATTRTTTLVPATHFSGGLVEVRQSCRHCHQETVTQRHTPALEHHHHHHGSSSSGSWGGGGSSGSSGGGFGGGSSGGGGAGSSW